MPSVAVIKPIWLSSEQPCGKRLKEPLPIWLPHFERREGALSKALRRSVLAASAATLDRLLSPYRSAHPKRWPAGPRLSLWGTAFSRFSDAACLNSALFWL